MNAKRVCIVLGGLALLLVAGWTLMVAGIYAIGGIMTIDVADRADGVRFSIPVPMALVHLAVDRLASPAIYTAGLGEVHVDGIDVDLASLAPAVVELAAELDRLPDAVLVEVMDGDDYVRIAKRADKLVVEVEDPRTSLQIEIPTRAALRLTDQLFR